MENQEVQLLEEAQAEEISLTPEQMEENVVLDLSPVPEEAVPVPNKEEHYSHVDDLKKDLQGVDIDAVKKELGEVIGNVLQHFLLNNTKSSNFKEAINLPSDLDANISRALDYAPSVKLNDGEQARKWANTLKDGLNYNTDREILVKCLNDKEAEFSNHAHFNNQSLNASVPRSKAKNGENLSGEMAMIHLMNHIGTGTVFQVPLFHSGIWVTFKPPVDSELVELHRQINAEKVRYGRESYGLLYSNKTAFILDKVTSFAIEHVFSLTTKTEAVHPGNLREFILSQDIPVLLWGLICSMYPTGFDYNRSCTTQPEKCNHVVSETLNVQKLQFTNMKALSEWQKSFMAGRQPRMKSLEDVKRYQDELIRLQKKRVTFYEGLPNEISITLRSPNLKDYVEAGHQWIAGIIENVNVALGTDASQSERNNTITMHGFATTMRQYSHWVDSIEFNGSIIDDRESVENNLGMLTSDDELREKFIDTVIDYINHSTISVIGIPVYDCPKCGETQEGNKKLPHHVNVIPLDVVQTFFGLTSLRLERMLQRLTK